MRLSEILINIVAAALALGTLCVTIYLLFGSCSARADEYAPAGKDFNGIWEERVFPQFVSLPDLATCEQFISWSEDQQKRYKEMEKEQ